MPVPGSSITDTAAPAVNRGLRAVGWALLPAFAGAYWIASGSSVIASSPLLAWVGYGLPVLFTVIFGTVCAVRSEGIERRFWALLSVANGALFASETVLAVWLIAIDPAGPPRIAWPFQTLHLVAAISFLGVLASMSRLSSGSPTARTRYLTDIAIMALVLYAISLMFYVRPIMEPTADRFSDMLVGAGYPVVAVLLLLGAIMNVAGFKIGRWRSWERLVIVALAVYVAGVALWPLWYATAAEGTRTTTRSVLDLVQLSGHYVLMMATVYRLTAGTEWFVRPLPPVTLGKRRWLSAVFPLSALVAVALAVGASYHARNDGSWALVYALVALLLMTLVLVRSTLLALEHSTLFHRSITDPLTGLYNHRYFHDRLADEIHAAQRFHDVLSLIVLDLDDFGQVNSEHGHTTGDLLLASLAERLLTATDRRQSVARIGGDEFAVILPGVDTYDATIFAQKLIDRMSIEEATVSSTVTLSAGVASFPEHSNSPDGLFRLADSAMLAAKERGKSRVVTYDSERVPALGGRERADYVRRQARLSSVRALAAAVDARDPATQNHSQHVSTLSVRLAHRLGMDEERVRLLELAALMHDVGKIGVPDAVLGKNGPLDDDERAKVRVHSALGERILTSADLPEVLPWVRAHHERWDGLGYPDGLQGEGIPLEARILQVCDAYDAMVSDRPYRRALSAEEAMREVLSNLGTQFDPGVATELLRMLTEDLAGEPVADERLGV